MFEFYHFFNAFRTILTSSGPLDWVDTKPFRSRIYLQTNHEKPKEIGDLRQNRLQL